MEMTVLDVNRFEIAGFATIKASSLKKISEVEHRVGMPDAEQ